MPLLQSYKSSSSSPFRDLLARVRYAARRWTAIPARPAPDALLDGLIGEDDEFRHLSFTFAAIALSAKVACADGELTRDKYLAFREAFPLRAGLCGKIRSLFALACDNPTPPEHYVNQIRHLFPRRRRLFAALMLRLFTIAAADGALSRREDELLSRIAHQLGLSPALYAELRGRALRPGEKRAHQVLGVGRKAGKRALKQRYHELMRRYHPDRYASEELSPEVDALLRLKASEINTAYRALSRKAA